MNGSSLSAWWGLPFAGMLLSIALGPLLAPAFWHRHFGKLAAFWALAFLLPCAALLGPGVAAAAFVHALLDEYVPFVLLLTALYTVAGGIHVRGNLHGSPWLNAGLLALGGLLASLMGTTGAAMLLLRPLLRANDNRRHNAHVVVFFIFIVANAGGALTPLGDPPLFLGFLRGVDFFWTLKHLWPLALFLNGCLLAIFVLVDHAYFRKEGVLPRDPTPYSRGFGLEGGVNLLLLAAILGLVLASGLGLPGWLRDGGLVLVMLLSWKLTPAEVHQRNQYSWAPMVEVALLFAGIFLTIAPVIAALKAGAQGPFAAVLAAVTRPDGQPDPAMYFWATGLLSSFLDNAPTYLVFFSTAGGDAQALMGQGAVTLAAISAGAVFMGANSYIGNAPNLMVKAVAEARGVAMPGFFGYMAWAGAVLLPLFLIMTFIWFR